MNDHNEKGNLRLSLQIDDDGTASLCAIAKANGFAGCGSAWFENSTIRKFALGIAKYPLVETVAIAGGYYSRSNPSELEQTHLSIRVYPLDGRGQLGVRVTLTDTYQSGNRMDSVHSAALEICTTYNRLERFSRDIVALLDGRVDEAVLEEDRL